MDCREAPRYVRVHPLVFGLYEERKGVEPLSPTGDRFSSCLRVWAGCNSMSPSLSLPLRLMPLVLLWSGERESAQGRRRVYTQLRVCLSVRVFPGVRARSRRAKRFHEVYSTWVLDLLFFRGVHGRNASSSTRLFVIVGCLHE
ncbi:hypothetical protein CSUI_010463 [Cystoisospora suis]|uniref:Uncharacterized protein n=1 Tax=Cystoisospora suis TaxID=483139 RepID=A0A2C6KHB2_9APIC|nr:hypothetical protein CSUI_010463 [Cystoisospora suis]